MDTAKYYAIITAGGIGKRMRSPIPKQFLEMGGKSILHRTIEQFTGLKVNGQDIEIELIVVLPHSFIEAWKQYCLEKNVWLRHTIVGGGITRFHSVREALKFVPDGAVVAVHDGVRPFVSKELILKILTYQFTGNVAGVIPVMPMIDSLRRKNYGKDGGVISTTALNRENYITIQTPQAFDSTRLKLAYNKPYSDLFTDDASVVESAGYLVDTVEGSRANVKITTPEDLKLFSSFASF